VVIINIIAAGLAREEKLIWLFVITTLLIGTQYSEEFFRK
jgi:hypothetical protein